MGKGNYYSFATALYGATLAPEAGLAGWSMPGLSNIPQTMLFEQTNRPAPTAAAPVNWFRAEGIPIAPYDDAHKKNPYPLMRMVARNAANQPIATNDVVLPVSDEMDCRACHASGTQRSAKPAAGWVWDGLPERDFRLNILRLHDENEFSAHPDLYAEALAARGFNPQGLYRGVLADGKPVLCAACHASEALGAPSYSTIPALTASVHS
jgi:cytochrome c5